MFEPVTAAELDALRARLAPVGVLPNTDRIDLIRAAEDLKNALAGLQAVLTADFDAATRAEQAAAGVPARRRGAGVASQIGLARRESIHHATRHVGLATLLTAEMPHTLAALRAGVISEWRATVVVRETATLTVDDRRAVDAHLCADPSRLEACGDRRVAEEARRIAYELDPHAVVNRAAAAVQDRFVSIRPAPDTMTYLTALLPVVEGVKVHAALSSAAERARCAGDPRGRGAVMADTLVARVVGSGEAETPAEATTKVVVNLVMTDRALLGDSEEPAVLDGYGVVPAGWARAQVAETEAFVRRLYVAPTTGALVAMEARSRHLPAGLRDLIRYRDRTCRIPYCDAPIAHHDHLHRHTDGGPTSAANIAGLCAAHNLDREAPGYHHVPDDDPHHRRRRRHGFTMSTPTGHHYRSIAPAPPGTAA